MDSILGFFFFILMFLLSLDILGSDQSISGKLNTAQLLAILGKQGRVNHWPKQGGQEIRAWTPDTHGQRSRESYRVVLMSVSHSTAQPPPHTCPSK